MRKLLTITILILAGSFAANGQSTECPASSVCISPEAARKALQDSDTVKAQEVEIKAKDQAIEDYKKLVNDLKVDLAKITGEKTGSDQMVVRLSALLDFALKNTKKKRNALITIF